METANTIKVGDIVEFEPGSPVLVMSIEANYDDDSDYVRKCYGESLLFGCSFTTLDPELARTEGENTFYVRRELSPVSGRVVR